MDQVSQSGRAVVMAKHGKVVVKLVPANENEDAILGAWQASPKLREKIENTVPTKRSASPKRNTGFQGDAWKIPFRSDAFVSSEVILQVVDTCEKEPRNCAVIPA
jgi:antitoxin (DNA-binding transcriptional repressor) of toxin-antitoxin stability system